MKPRVLFVSRERFHLPLEGAQKRKWDAVSTVVEPRVLAAARDGSPMRDERFRLVGRARVLDGPLFYLLLPFRIARQLRDFRPQAALVQGIHETVAFLVARRLAGVPAKVILDVQGDWHGTTRLYGSPARRLLNPLNDALAAPAVRGADAVRTVSEQTTSLVRTLGVEPIATFPSFVDAETFLERPREPLPDRPGVAFVGVLEAIKGFDTLCRAWPQVVGAVPDAALTIVGDGSLRALVPASATWERRLPADGVADVLDASWLLCLPSRSEGLPRVALEAACRNRAIVGGDAGGIPDVVRDGRSGILVVPGDVSSLVSALIRVLSDRALAERLGAGARETAEAWELPASQYAAKVHALVQQTLDG